MQTFSQPNISQVSLTIRFVGIQLIVIAIFHLWSLVNRSRMFDSHYVDLLSRIARENLPTAHVPFGPYGIFNKEQAEQIFTAILRLLEIPVGQSTPVYSNQVDVNCGIGAVLAKDPRKNPPAHSCARWIVMSLSPACVKEPDSILSNLSGLIEAVETFFHPSNAGAWTKTLCQLVSYLTEFFVMRWNRESSGDLAVPEDRRLTPEVRRAFVLCLREVTFMGIYSKSGTAMSASLSALKNLAYLEPELILPGALHRIYPSMQGLVEVHRTTSSLRALKVLARTLIRSKGFRCHLTTLLSLALPGIDANDLDKTQHTLHFMQMVAYDIPFYDLDQGGGSMLAMEWVNNEMERLESGGASVEVDYSQLSDEEEKAILCSSTAGFGEFIISFIGRIFILLENLPDAAKMRTNSPEEQVISTLPSVLLPFFSTLSPELYDIALQKVVQFASNNVIHQARDAMAYLVNALCRANPQKALKAFVPLLIGNIRNEIEENGAASTRHTGADVLPRDRALLWNISLLSMCAIYVGDELMKYSKEFTDIILFMQEHCKGIATLHVSNLVHHILLNCTMIHANELSIIDPEEIKKGVNPDHWGYKQNPKDLKIRWHVPSSEEVAFACGLFESQTQSALAALEALIGPNPPIARDGSDKEWSDEVARNMTLLRLLLSGISNLFDRKYVEGTGERPKAGSDKAASQDSEDVDMKDEGDDGSNDASDEDDDAGYDSDDEEIIPSSTYPSGYHFKTWKDPLFIKIHDLRSKTGEMLHRMHVYLTENQEDDVPCFNSLYTAFRTFFVDVGLEKSATTMERVIRLLSHDQRPYKMVGLCKDYPRPILVRRAGLYHIQRIQRKAGARHRTPLDDTLLNDLAHSAVSLYTDIRRHAQSAIESAVKVLLGSKSLIIPKVLNSLELALEQNEHRRIKGAMYTLLFGTLAKAVGKDWRYTPRVVKAYIIASTADRPSIQRLATGVTYQMMEYGKEREKTVVYDEKKIDTIKPKEDLLGVITKKRNRIRSKNQVTEDKKRVLAEELVEIASKSHWKTAVRTATVLFNLGLRFQNIAPDGFLDLVMKGVVDDHPGLRNIYSGIANSVFCHVELRAMCQHEYRRYITDQLIIPGKTVILTDRYNPEWTSKFLGQFAQPEVDYYVDHECHGWLIWQDTIPAFEKFPKQLEYDDVEQHVRQKLGKHITADWLKAYFAYLKQEPRDSSADKFRISFVTVLHFVFTLAADGLTEVTFEDIKREALVIYGPGTDKHEHRAMAEIVAGMISAHYERTPEDTQKLWDFVFPFLRKVFDEQLNPENLSYWTTFIHVIFESKDIRRLWPIAEFLSSFRLDMNSNAAFKESSKISLLHQCAMDNGWHFQLYKPILADFLAHIDHPYKGVREAMGDMIATIYRSQHHESYADLKTFMKAQYEGSPVGLPPYTPSEEFHATMEDVFTRLEKWRHERPPGQQSQSSYTAGSKTVLLWLDSTLSSYECTQLIPFFHKHFVKEFLWMLEVKEDQELMTLAYHVFRLLPNIPLPVNQDKDFINELIRIGIESKFWHQRLRILMNMQVVYFRRLFLINEDEQIHLFEFVTQMLNDAQAEVRVGAATTLSGMIRCSPVRLRDRMIQELKTRFTKMLTKHTLPKRSPTGTPTPDYTRNSVLRHAAVLGLGALAQAFPYQSPPPKWLPEVLATLASKAAGDPGMVGKSVKTALSDFKKTRQDTWHVDVKVRALSRWRGGGVEIRILADLWDRRLRASNLMTLRVCCGGVTLRRAFSTADDCGL